MFGKNWFKKHQRLLLWLLNKPLVKYWFRWVLRIHKDLKREERIVGISPNHYDVLVKQTKKRVWLRSDFRTHNKFTKRIFYAFYPIWWLCHQWDILFANRFVPQLNFGFDTLTVYPDADPETYTVDGFVMGAWRSTWAQTHNEASSQYVRDANVAGEEFGWTGPGNNYNTQPQWNIARVIALFRYNIPASAINISSATINWCSSITPDAIVVNDYDAIVICATASTKHNSHRSITWVRSSSCRHPMICPSIAISPVPNFSVNTGTFWVGIGINS